MTDPRPLLLIVGLSISQVAIPVDAATCPKHGEELQPDRVPVLYGYLPSVPDRSAPCARTYEPGGCGVREPRVVEVEYCATCRGIYEALLKATHDASRARLDEEVDQLDLDRYPIDRDWAEDLLERAINLGHADAVGRLLAMGLGIETRPNRLPLVHTVRDVETLEILLDAGADPNEAWHGLTALHVVASRWPCEDSLKQAALLIGRGADPMLICPPEIASSLGCCAETGSITELARCRSMLDDRVLKYLESEVAKREHR